MALGIRYAILNLILVLFTASAVIGEIVTDDLTYKVRRDTGATSGNSKYWSKNNNIDKFRNEILASLPAELPSGLLNSQARETKSTQIEELSPLARVRNVQGFGSANDAREQMDLLKFMSRNPARGIYRDESHKRNGFFFGKRNGFFFGKRDAEAVNPDSCVSCGPENDGQCVMYGTCCSPKFGCFMMTKESEACVTNQVGGECWKQESSSSCGNGGLCAADSVCCLPYVGFCHIDASCSAQTTID